METLKNTTDKKERGLVHKVKMAAAILLGALAINAATSQNANAQDLDFSNITSKKDIAEIDKQNAEKKNTIAKNKKDIAAQEKIIAELRGKKGDKHPPKGSVVSREAEAKKKGYEQKKL